MYPRKRISLIGAGLIILLLLAGCSFPTQQDQAKPPALSVQESQPEGQSSAGSAMTTGLHAALSQLEGDVQLREGESDAFQPAQEGDILYLAGQVQTGEDGRVRLYFEDDTFVRVGPSSLFTLEDIQTAEDGSLLKRLFLEVGQLWVVLNGGELEVDTPSGVASVRGSYLSVWLDPDTGEIYITCLEGECTLECAGELVTLGAGETALGIPGTPIVSGFMTLEEIQLWLNEVSEALTVVGQVPGLIGDWVWEDANGNGLQDPDETGLPDVFVNLLSADGDVLDTTATQEAGFFSFYPVLTGEYILEFVSPEGYIFTLQDEGGDDTEDSDADADGKTANFELAPGEHNNDLDAGLLQPSSGAVCPFTGLPVEEPALLDLRPLFISVSHFPAASTRPPTGLNSAPVVFETLIDEGMTRLQALFYCGYPEEIPANSGGDSGDGGSSSGSGSSPGGAEFDISGVRSGRIFYGELAQLFGAGLIYGGASPEVYPTIAPYTCAFADSSKPNDIGAAGLSIDRLIEIAADCQTHLGNPDFNVWTFGPAPEGGEAVEKFLMHYNYLNQTRWIFDADAGGYVRYQNDPASPEDFTLSTDRLTGEPVVRQNIIILQTPHTVLNSSGTIIEFDLTDEGGFAYLLRDGYAYKVCWSAMFDDYPTPSNRYRPFLLLDCTTKEQINFAHGSTWINIVDYSVGYSWVGDYWRAYQPFLGYGD